MKKKKDQLGSAKGMAFPHEAKFPAWQVGCLSLLLFGLVVCVFLPATRNGLINYDDTAYVTENSHVQGGLTWANLCWALTTGCAVNWHPLTWLSHMADCQFYGLEPFGHHLTSVLLHAGNVALLFLVLWRMTGAVGRSLLVAALFGMHPLRVESVAWVAERKDVLSGCFFMLTLLAYAEYARRWKIREPKSKLFYVLSLAAFCCGLMSKPMLVTMPFLLLLLDWWPLCRVSGSNLKLENLAPSNQAINKRHGGGSSRTPGPSSQSIPRASTFTGLLYEKVPFVLLAIASSAATYAVQESSGAVYKSLPWIARAENAVVSYCRYVGKLFLPVDLAVYYPHVHLWPAATVLACVGMLAGVSVLVIALSRRCPCLPVGWFWYLGTLVPAIGLVQVGSQAMADRYTYLPMIGLLVMIVWGMYDLAGRSRNWEVILCAAGAAAVMGCAVLTVRQISWWKDSETLFRHAIAVTKENTIALDNLGRALGERGQLDEAIEQYHQALGLDADDPLAYNGLGACLILKRDYEGAAGYLREALRLNPNDPLAHSNLGVVLARQGLFDEAISQFEAAAKFKPDDAGVQNNLGAMLAGKRRFDDAIPHYRQAIRLKPDDATSHKNLGVALVATGRLDEAIEQFQEAVSLKPDFPEAQERLRLALASKANTSPPVNPASKP